MFVITVAYTLTVGPSGIIACVLLWERPGRLVVYLLLVHGTRRQFHHKVVSRPTPKSNNGIPNGTSFDTAITIELRFALLNGKCFWFFRSLFQRARSFAFMPFRSISCVIDCSWTCSAMADLELCPSLIASQCSFFRTRSARFRLHIHQSTFCISRSTPRWWSNLLEVGPSMYKESSNGETSWELCLSLVSCDILSNLCFFSFLKDSL